MKDIDNIHAGYESEIPHRLKIRFTSTWDCAFKPAYSAIVDANENMLIV